MSVVGEADAPIDLTDERPRVAKRPRATVEVVVGGDLLCATESIIAQQTNCESKGARGLAKVLFAKWPAANVYKQRRAHSTPGTVEARTVDGGRKRIVALHAQRSPGSAREFGDDSDAARLCWFERCLTDLAEIAIEHGETVVAMPYNIGCGLAGGEWAAYLAAIERFADRHKLSARLYDVDRLSEGGQPSGIGGGKRASGASDLARVCLDCAAPIGALEPFKTRCLVCWRKSLKSG